MKVTEMRHSDCAGCVRAAEYAVAIAVETSARRATVTYDEGELEHSASVRADLS